MILPAHTTTDADHGRIEERRHSVCHNTQWLFSARRYTGEPQFSHLAMIAMVENHVERDGQKAPSGAIISLPPHSMRKRSPPPFAPIEASKTASTGSSMPSSMTTAQDCEPAQDPRIWPSSNISP
jgi:hypothetical protein